MHMIESGAPSYLLVVASSCQMYSGTGTAIFDWVRYARDRFRFHLVMDVENDANFRLTQKFCADNGIAFTASRGLPLAGCIDSGIREVNALLEASEFDFVECVSWANAATNLGVLASKKPGAKLIFVPHSQPMWTLPEPERYFMVPLAFEQTLAAADYVFIDSPAETKLEAFKAARPGTVHFLPLGVGSEFRYSPEMTVEPAQILCVCDCREQRKRVDLLLKVFARIHSRNPEARLVLGGKGSDAVELPQEIRSVVTTLGYVDRETLIRLYQSSGLFLLLSDYEAFGLPIAEALSCGCPVLLNDFDVLRDVFAGMEGVQFVKNTDVEQAAVVACQIIEARPDRSAVAQAALRVFSFAATYGRKCEILLGERGGIDQ